MNETNIYQKLLEIRKGLKSIKKEEVNKFQNYNYISEYTYFNKINPLLEQQRLIMICDDTKVPIDIRKEGKEWVVSYQKQLIIIDVETEKSLTFKVWGVGQNADIAKAKGSAETYVMKYFLQKFFMIPVSDKAVSDPDAMNNGEMDDKNQAETNRELTEEEKKEVAEIVERHGLDVLPEKCAKCGQEFSAKLLKEAKTRTGEVKKVCFSCYDEAIKASKK